MDKGYPDQPQLQRLRAAVITRETPEGYNFERARGLLLRASASDQNDPELHYFLARLYVRQGLRRLAAQSYARMLDLLPRNSEARYALARLYMELKEPALFARQYAIHDQLIEEQRRLKKLQESVNAKPRDPLRHLRVARFYEGTRERGQAVAEYQVTQSLSPANEASRAALKRLYTELDWGNPEAIAP